MGHHLASWLLARGERVVDVPPRSTARVRQLSRGGRRKNDRIDAAAAACVAALAGDANPLQPDGPAEALALLDERRSNLAQARVRTANQLHALLRALLAGRRPARSIRHHREKLIASVRPAGQVERIRIQLATDLVTDLRSLDAQLRANAKEMAKLVAQSGSTLTSTGIGVVTAARLIGRTGPASRFPSAAAFVNYTGPRRSNSPAPTAPATACPALATGNSTPRCTPWFIQIRMPESRGHRYYKAKIAEGKTPREAQRCLKRRLADHIWRTMTADERRQGASPGGHTGAALSSSAAGPTPTASSSDQSQPRPAAGESTDAAEPARTP